MRERSDRSDKRSCNKLGHDMFTRSACATNDPRATLASWGRVHDVAQIERRRRSALLVEATRTGQCQCSHVSTFFYYSVTRKQKMSGTKRTARQAALEESKKAKKSADEEPLSYNEKIALAEIKIGRAHV